MITFQQPGRLTRRKLAAVRMAIFFVAGVGAVLLPGMSIAQTCTMQAQMQPEVYSAVHDAALAIATAVQHGDGDKVRSMAATESAANFGAVQSLIAGLAPKLSGDTLTASQVFQLNAEARKPGDVSTADFICTPPASVTEVDFSISGLAAGTYVFAMVEAAGPQPWLLSMLLKQEAGAWKLAGLYPHARNAAGHDGLWYWRAARDDVKANKPWLAWFYFNLADALLRPANFVVSSHLDALRAEQHSAAPPALAEGVNPQTPLSVQTSAAATPFAVTDLVAEPSDDGAHLNIVLHVRAEALPDAAAERARNLAAATAFVDAHPELRQGFSSVFVFTEAPGQNPFVTENSMISIP